MDQKQRKIARMAVAVGGIGAFCAVAVFIAIAILFIRQDAQSSGAAGVPVDVGGQIIIIYPDPAMSVKVVSAQPEGSSPGSTPGAPVVDQGTAQVGTGGQGQEPVATATQQLATLPPPPTPVPSQVILVNYVVVPGDTLYRLTQKHNTSIELMARYNIAAAQIVVGNSLMLPVANPGYCPNSRPHVVRDQQTVSEIARAYNTTPQAIAAASGLDANYSVKTTQVICVPY